MKARITTIGAESTEYCENAGVQIHHYHPSHPTTRYQKQDALLRRRSLPVRLSCGRIPVP